jgi:exodeoxyribonuclease VII small subunit
VKTKPASSPADKLPDFEQSLSELEALVQKLEQGDVPLEDALKTFERGVAPFKVDEENPDDLGR